MNAAGRRDGSPGNWSIGSSRITSTPGGSEVEDTALLIDLGAQGLGFIPVYSAVLRKSAVPSRFQTIGIAKGLRMEVFAITAQRRLQTGELAMTKPEDRSDRA